jgi:hypothetical protein
MKGIKATNMSEKKYEITANNSKQILNDNKYVGYLFELILKLHDGKEASLTANIDITGMGLLNTSLNMQLSCQGYNTLNVLYSTFHPKLDLMFLDLIEIKEPNLQNIGLGSLILESWFKLLPEFSNLYNISFSSIEGHVHEGSNYTPEYAKKLYSKFNGHVYSNNQQLRLEEQLLEQSNYLKYTFELINP